MVWDSRSNGRPKSLRVMPKRNRKPVGDPATKARLAKRACDLFAQRGYFRVTVADIVRSGGVARGTFYIYWRSKQDCFE